MSDRLATRLVHELAARGLTVATGESLTGGLVCAELVSVPGASEVVSGGVVAYTHQVKVSLLGVDAALLEREGAVNAATAEQLARGARDEVGAHIGLGTTGVAGPDPSDGQPVGTVYVAVAGEDVTVARRLELSGDRAQIRADAVDGVLALLAEHLALPTR